MDSVLVKVCLITFDLCVSDLLKERSNQVCLAGYVRFAKVSFTITNTYTWGQSFEEAHNP